MIPLDTYLRSMTPVVHGYVSRKASRTRPLLGAEDLSQDVAETLIKVWQTYGAMVTESSLRALGTRAMRKRVTSIWRRALTLEVPVAADVDVAEVPDAGEERLETALLYQTLLAALRDAPKELLIALFTRVLEAGAPPRRYPAYGLRPRRRVILEICRETGLAETEVTQWVERIYDLCRNVSEELT